MESRDPDSLISAVERKQKKRGEIATKALQWFLDGNVGELFLRADIVQRLSDELNITRDQANTAVTETVGDIVDPVQQIVKGPEKYVGVINYKVFSDEGAYGYVDFDDRKGQRKRVVCARCVEKNTYDEDIVHATQGEGTSSVDATWQQLLNKVASHYASQHNTAPSEIKPGASLVSGTTISGNSVFHSANDGEGSGLDADTVRGQSPSSLGGINKFEDKSAVPSNISSNFVYLNSTDAIYKITK